MIDIEFKNETGGTQEYTLPITVEELERLRAKVKAVLPATDDAFGFQRSVGIAAVSDDPAYLRCKGLDQIMLSFAIYQRVKVGGLRVYPALRRIRNQQPKS